MSERDFEENGYKFKLNKIDTFKQFHIVRRIGPILGDIMPVVAKLRSKFKDMEEEQDEGKKFEQIALLIHPIMQGLSKLSDQDADFVLLGLLSAIEMQQININGSSLWMKVSNDSGLQFQSLELPTLLQIAGRSFAYNLRSFFSLLPQTSHGEK